MTRVQAQPVKTGITQRQFNLEMQMAVVNDVASDLKIICDQYDDLDPQYGGPPSKELLENLAQQLSLAYLKMAVLTGQDPCEKLESTKVRLEAIRSSRWDD
jgi:hypothetical protein